MTELVSGLSQGETLVILVVVLWTGIVLWAAVRPNAPVARYSTIAVTILAIGLVTWQSKSVEKDSSIPRAASIGPSCTIVHFGMTSDEVIEAMGPAEQKVSDEDVRGPSAEHWVYPASQCRVHFLDGIVRAVD